MQNEKIWLSQIPIGHIYKIPCKKEELKETSEDKPKYCISLGQARFLLINTDDFGSPDNVDVKKREYPFLEYDSFLYFGEIISLFDRQIKKGTNITGEN